ncbi:prestin-like [Saccoglossus kowalevskii]
MSSNQGQLDDLDLDQQSQHDASKVKDNSVKSMDKDRNDPNNVHYREKPNIDQPPVQEQMSNHSEGDPSEHHLSYRIERPLYSQEEFKNYHKENDMEYVPYKQRIKQKIKKCQCNLVCTRGCMLSTFPISKWLSEYKVRDQLVGDLVSGATVCVMNIPQGMAYAMLASLPPVYGLYMSFFAPIVYGVTGTCKELAMGTFAVSSIMVSAAIESVVPLYPDGSDDLLNNYMDNNTRNTTSVSPLEWNRQQELVDAAVVLALLVGIIQLCMGIVHLGWITIYLSNPFIRGYTTGAAVYVLTSQIDDMLGISVGRYTGAFKIVYVYRDIFTSLHECNYVTVLLSVSCIVVLVVIKEVEFRCKKRLHGYPLGSELIVVVVGTLSSYFLNLEENHDVDVIGDGDIPAGLPPPRFPPTTYLTSLIGAAFPIALVSFSISVALASLFSQKKNYKIDANQELIAYGSTNVICSMFSCYASSGSMGRSLVQESTGGTSQIAGFVNSALMLIVLLWIGPLFETLPTAVLSAIVLVALKGIFKQVLDLPKLFKYDMIDFHVWWVSCVAVVLFNVDQGLLIGVGFSIFVHVWRTQEPYCTLLGRIPGTDLYKDIKWYSSAIETPGIKIFRMQASLYYANTEHFKSKVYKLTGINPRKILQSEAKKKKNEEKDKKESEQREVSVIIDENEEMVSPVEPDIQSPTRSTLQQRSTPIKHVVSDDWIVGHEFEEFAPGHKVPLSRQNTFTSDAEDDPERNNELTTDSRPEESIHTIIIDFSSINFIDSTGLTGLRQLFNEYHKLGIQIFFAQCKKRVRDYLAKADFFEHIACKVDCCLFVTIHDAVLNAVDVNTYANADEVLIHNSSRGSFRAHIHAIVGNQSQSLSPLITPRLTPDLRRNSSITHDDNISITIHETHM